MSKTTIEQIENVREDSLRFVMAFVIALLVLAAGGLAAITLATFGAGWAYVVVWAVAAYTFWAFNRG